MADTLTTQSATPATIPASTVIATDDAGAAGHVQVVKLAVSTDGSATPISADADGLQVNLGANNDVTVTGSVTANAGTNLNTSALATEATLDARTGTLTETAPATDTASSGLNGRLQRIAQRITSLITALGSPFQAGGSIGNTTFASTQSGTWNVNNVSGTVSLPTGASTSAKQDTEITALQAIQTAVEGTLSVSGTVTAGAQYTEGDTDTTITGTAALVEGAANALAVLIQPLTDTQIRATPLPVSGSVTANLGTIADVATQTTLAAINTKLVTGTDIGDVTINNAAGVSAVNIQDGGNTITVDGTVAATQSGTWNIGTVTTITNVVHVDDNSSTLSIDDGGGSITVDGTVSVSGTVTVGSHAVTNAGTFAVQVDGAALTSLQLADDVIKTLGTDTYTEATTKGTLIGAVRRDADTTLVDTTNEVSPLQVDANGRLKVEAFSGETLPVSLTSTTVTGTVAVTQSGTWDEVGINDSGNSITVDAPVGTPAFVRLSDGSSAIATLPVSLASVPSHAVTNAGTFAVQVDGAALTSLQLIDDTVSTLGTDTYTEATTKGLIMGAVRRDADTTLVNTTNEVSPLQVDANGRLKVEAFSGETLPVSLTSTTVTGTVAVTQSGTWDEVGINDSGNSITVDNGGTFVTQENGALLTSAQLIDDIVYTDDTSTHSTGSSKGALIMAAATPTDTAVNANDIGAVGMTNNRALYVSVQDALPAGSAAIGKLAANSGVDIGDVDITSIAAGDNNIGNVDVVTLPAIPTGTNTIGSVKVTDGTTVATVRELGTNDALNVSIVDGSGNQIVSFGGGTQYTEADTDASITGTAVMWEDASDTLRAVSAAKPLPVEIIAGSSSGTQYTEDAAAASNPVATALNLVRDDSRGGSLTTTDGDNVAARGTNAGELYVKHVDAIPVTQSGTWDEVGINDSGNSITVDNGGTFVTQENGAALTSLQLIDDTIYTAGTSTYTEATSKGALSLAVRRDADTTLADTTNEMVPLQVNAGGQLKVAVIAALPAGTAAIGKLAANSGVDIGDVDILSIAAGDNNIGNVDIVTMPNVTLAAGTNTNEVVGDVAHDAVAAGNPVLMGAYASAAVPTNVSADADAVRLWALRSGALASQQTYAGVLAVAGNGASGTGVQRVTMANDSTGILAGVTTVTTVTTLSTLTGGGVAHDAVDSGNPVKVGAKASATLSDDTMVANADRIDLTGDLDGALYVRNVPLGDLISEALSNTDGASTASTNFGATASTRSYITAITAFRTDTATTMAYIDFRDGTAGSVIYRVPLPPVGGVTINNGGAPLFYTTANTALAFDVSSALTTVYISLTGFKSKARA